MVIPKSEPATANELRERRLVRTWAEMKSEILRHQWLESEKAGYDIGWERARASWMIRYQSSFLRAKST